MPVHKLSIQTTVLVQDEDLEKVQAQIRKELPDLRVALGSIIEEVVGLGTVDPFQITSAQTLNDNELDHEMTYRDIDDSFFDAD